MTNDIFIVSEIGSVHDGSFGNASNLIDLASDCGANCVKFQTHISDSETLPDSPNPNYFDNESRFDYFNRTAFDLAQWKKLKAKADSCNVRFLSSPFSIDAVDLLEKVGVFGYKIPSGEVTNLPLLEKLAKIGKPVFLSSGMSTWIELDEAVEVLKNCDLTVMQCSSVYPCPSEQVGLNVITEMKDRYKCRIGFSDHTIGLSAAISAVTLGATVIEKHFTFSRKMYGSDAKHSMEPTEFATFCSEVNNTWKMLDNPVDKNFIYNYKEMKKIFEKSIIAACNIPKGNKLKLNHLAFKKPGDGIPASKYKDVIGRVTSRGIKENQKLSFKDFS